MQGRINSRLRLTITAVVTVTTLATGVGSAAPAVASPPPRADKSQTRIWKDRAVDSYHAMQTYLNLGHGGYDLYRENYPIQAGDPTYSYAWTMREATAAAVSLNVVAPGAVHRSDVKTPFDSLQKYWSNTLGHEGYQSYVVVPLGSGGDLYFDDNAVIGLEQIRGYETTHQKALLQSAELTFKTVIRGWDSNSTLPCPGGMMWYDSPNNSFRAANVTGLSAEYAAHLYQLTQQKEYLTWATKLFEWNQRCLEQSPGLYWNDIGNSGTVDKTLWTYNSGAMIGAATLLYETTGNRSYLSDAETEAQGALDYWTTSDRLYSQPAIFNAILSNNLLLLDSQAPNDRYRRVITDYAQREWVTNRNSKTGLFTFQPSGGGAPNPTGPAQTLEQSAMIQIFAALAWKPSDYGRIA